MTDINKVVELGRITRDLDETSFGYLSSGTARANISIAVNRSRKQGDQWIDEANYFDVTIFGKTAENLKPYLKKGTQICVEGFLKQDRWEKDGQKHSKIVIVAENVQLCGGKSNSGNTQNQENNLQQQSMQNKPTFQAVNPQQNYQNMNNGIQEDYPYPDSSDIPF